MGTERLSMASWKMKDASFRVFLLDWRPLVVALGLFWIIIILIPNATKLNGQKNVEMKINLSKQRLSSNHLSTLLRRHLKWWKQSQNYYFDDDDNNTNNNHEPPTDYENNEFPWSKSPESPSATQKIPSLDCHGVHDLIHSLGCRPHIRDKTLSSGIPSVKSNRELLCYHRHNCINSGFCYC